ncbi:hypothetical protein CKO27_00420 [Thiocystis violacea]|nr:hypothetical protein [Thiocystis violacea]
MLAVAYLAFAPLTEPVGFSYDKFNHLFAFAVMAWLADGGWPGPRQAWARWGMLLGYGLLIELVQRELPFRQFSWLDVMADAAGIAVYVAAKALIFGRRWLPRL